MDETGVTVNTKLAQVFAEYEERSAREIQLMQTLPHQQFVARIDEFLISIGHQAGMLLHVLATSAQARTFLELGTCYGYSTLWLADAARVTGGKVHSLELSSAKVDYARTQLQRVGLESYVEFHVGDALQSLATLAGPFDFVLLDLWKDMYVKCFEAFHPKLAPGALVAADNMTFPPEIVADTAVYQQFVRAQRDMRSLLLNVGNGIELSRKNL